MSLEIGKTYKSKATLDDGIDIRDGEMIKILEHNKYTKEYKVLNVNLGTMDAWSYVNEDVLEKILKQ